MIRIMFVVKKTKPSNYYSHPTLKKGRDNIGKGVYLKDIIYGIILKPRNKRLYYILFGT